MIVVEQQSLLSVLLQQGFDPGVLELDDLLLTLGEEAADGRKQNVPGQEQDGPGYRRNSASLQGWRMKSIG